MSLHRKFGSRKIIEICNELGFCGSYPEALLYKNSAAFQSYYEVKSGTAIQYVVDNFDFNVDTPDGKNTFHNLGRIAIISPSSGLEPRKQIKRCLIRPLQSEIIKKLNFPFKRTLSVKVKV